MRWEKRAGLAKPFDVKSTENVSQIQYFFTQPKGCSDDECACLDVDALVFPEFPQLFRLEKY
jgi:hypothetical protein